MKRLYFVLFLILMLCIPSLSVSANAPAPPSYFYCQVENASIESVYMDILIELDTQSAEYTAFNSKNTRGGITAQSQIATYSEDGYMSLSFHYIDVTSHLGIDSPYFTMRTYSQSIDKVSKTIKAVLLDKDGNILKISEAINTTPPTLDEFAYRLVYDANKSAPTLEFSHFYKGSPNSMGFTFPLLLMLLLRMFLSTTAETLIAIPFKIRPLWKIAVVNIVTQIILILFMSMSIIDLTYTPSLIVAESFVYIAEMVAYFLLFKEVPKLKIILYTICANTFTLLMGLFMNAFNILC